MSKRYSAVAIGLHWAIAVLLIGNIFLGWNMEDKEHRAIENLFQLHKSIGITVLFLSFARLFWRIMNPPPPLPTDMAKHEALLSHFVHWAFYGLMIGIPLTGWILVSISKFNVSTVLFGVVSWPHLPGLGELGDAQKSFLHGPVEFFHSKGAWMVIILAGLHISGAIKHELSSEDGVLKRMIPFAFGKTVKPERSRGAFLVFGGSLLIFAAIAAIPVISAATNQSSSDVTKFVNAESNWVIDYDQSSISFSGTHDGNAFKGEFESWNADIVFSEADLENAVAKVSVATGSAVTSKKLYTDTLKASEWFAPSSFPTADVTLSNFRETDSGYQADARIKIKETEVTSVLLFGLETRDDGKTVMNGHTQVKRTNLDLGLKSDPNGDWVSVIIDIQVKVVASPKE